MRKVGGDKAVLFDLGNVVIKIHFERCFQFWAHAAGKDPLEIAKSFTIDGAYSAHEVAGLTGAEYHAHINNTLGIDLSFKEFVDGWNSIFGETIPETMDLIFELKSKYKVFALTNSNLLHRSAWSEKYKDVLVNFDNVYCSSQLRARKPDAEAFARVCAKTAIQKEHFIFVDDLEANVVGAENFGITSVLFSNPKESTDKVRSLVFK